MWNEIWLVFRSSRIDTNSIYVSLFLQEREPSPVNVANSTTVRRGGLTDSLTDSGSHEGSSLVPDTTTANTTSTTATAATFVRSSRLSLPPPLPPYAWGRHRHTHTQTDRQAEGQRVGRAWRKRQTNTEKPGEHNCWRSSSSRRGTTGDKDCPSPGRLKKKRVKKEVKIRKSDGGTEKKS